MPTSAASSSLRTVLPTAVTVLMLAAVLAPHPAGADGDRTVLVTPVAPAAEASAFRFDPDRSPPVDRRPARTLMPDAVAPLAVNGFEVLPDDRFLLTGLVERGAVISAGADGFEFELGGAGTGRGVGAAAAAGIDDEGKLVRLALAENGEQRIAIYDRRFEERIWSDRLIVPPSRARITQLVSLPDHRLAAAVQWPNIGAAGVDVYRLGEDQRRGPGPRFADRTYSNAPDDLVVDDRLSTVRDVFGLDRKRLLVTTPGELLRIDLESRRIESIVSLEDLPGVAGEFVAARRFDPDRLVAATVEPGLWTNSHPNHRLYWIDPAGRKILGQSPPLAAAPWRVDTVEGHGASGTDGFSPGLDFLPTASTEQARLQGVPEIRPTPIITGTSGRVAVEVVNLGDNPLLLASVAVIAKPDACGGSAEPRVLAERLDVAIPPRRGESLRSSFQIPAGARTGTWCATVRIQTPGGDDRILGNTSQFPVASMAADAGPDTGDAGARDIGVPGGDGDTARADGRLGEPGSLQEPGGAGGCQCGSTGGSDGPFGWPVLAVMVGAAGTSARRETD